jgi:hypothetical protein
MREARRHSSQAPLATKLGSKLRHLFKKLYELLELE